MDMDDGYVQIRTLTDFQALFDCDEPDERAIAIQGAAYLDDLMARALSNFLVNEDNEVQRLLSRNGMLGIFDNKVSMLFCLGLINRIVRDDLRLIVKIRNIFTYEVSGRFTDEKITKYCTELKWREGVMGVPPVGATAIDLYQVGVNQLVAYLNGIATSSHCVRRKVMI